jgi:hypothetical protein
MDTRMTSPSAAPPAAIKAFVSYRRKDSAARATLIARGLEQSLGAEGVFFDVDDLDPGSEWEREIRARVSAADVVLVVIGPQWVGLADERGSREVLDPEDEDVVRSEIEAALRARALLVPVLVDGATMPPRGRLPRAFRPVTKYGGVSLRHESFQADLDNLIDSLGRRLAERSPEPAPEPRASAETNGGPAAERPPGLPDPDHFAQIIKRLERRDVLVPVLGSSLFDPRADAPWRPGCGRMPDSHELARALAAEFDVPPEPADLARIAQHIVATGGAVDLHGALAEMLGGDDCEPAPVHRFLARLPRLLRERGHERCQLIVSANYDGLLERAFEEAGEPFDVAVFIASEEQGRFLHIPWWDREGRGAVLVDDPNAYGGFPINENGELDRTVIVKLHGGMLHGAPAQIRRDYKDNFVITEDHYIGYLTRASVENLIPIQLLDKLRGSHYLFLGYNVRDWSLRVFLRRVWRKGLRGWAIQHSLDRLDRGFWEELDVERIDTTLTGYLEELERRLAS